MTSLNAVLGTVIDWLQLPFRGLPPIVGVIVWSIPVSIFALWVFGKTSNQEKITEVKSKIDELLAEIKKYKQDVS